MNAYSLLFRLAKHNNPNSAVHWPKDIFEKLPSNSIQRRSSGLNSNSAITSDYFSSEGKTTNDWRFGAIVIDWIDRELVGTPKISMEPQNTVTQNQQKNKSVMRNADDNFSKSRMYEGSTTLPEGVVHMYRHSHNYNQNIATFTPVDQDTSIIDSFSNKDVKANMVKVDDSNDGSTLAVLAVPSYMTPIDFMTFIAPASESIAHLRMIRDSSPNRSIVLLKFRAREDAILFSQEYNGRPYNVLEVYISSLNNLSPSLIMCKPSEICHVVNVISVEIESNDATSLAISRLATAQSNLHELPTCPVCLERMDTSVTGLVTVPCSHTFHCMCLSKWGDSRCPVCRYSQTRLPPHNTTTPRRTITEPPSASGGGPSLSVCFDCSSTSNLWICLICGNVGCGRYGRAHAHAHYELTMHLYSLELETQRVWDYAGDGYIHRLIQNKTDGKLVELPSASTAMATSDADGSRLGPSAIDSMQAEKMEAIGIEYSYLLTSQLDSQREYYEQQKVHLEKLLGSAQEKIEILDKELSLQKESERNELRRMRQEDEERQVNWQRERSRIEKRSEKLAEVARTLERELKEERAVSQGLLKNLEKVRQKAEIAEQERKQTEKRVGELEEHVRDLMIYLDVKDKISAGDGGILREAAGGSVQIPAESKVKKKKTGK
ncbi:hypothetical protein Clacol_005456 [Clathrus columnatus]|uniref:BRCA1-associated protein n=1 Tax=Clathrus columnatus TaxID=1419009 RepID=A0AAV5ADI1_9AGAM|nr:hypothetical protein Clacol_005456 [Clathrus columnatus]